MGVLAKAASAALKAPVRAYQASLGHLMGGCCRFEPSCSNYMLQAIDAHGPAKGLVLGLWRILRCHPFGKSGYDPVPPEGKWKNDFSENASNEK